MSYSDESHFDVALSFAGKQREYVEEVAKILRKSGIKVFYDDFNKVSLWGTDLGDKLDEIYRLRSKYVVIFISKEYKEGMWTNHERKSAFSRAIRESKEFILPVRFDATELPGLRPSISYIDAMKEKPKSIAELIINKISSTSYLDRLPEPKEDLNFTHTSSFSLAKTILVYTYKVRDAIRSCQNPFMSSAELNQRKPEEGESEEKSLILSSYYAHSKRYERVQEALKELYEYQLEAEAVFGRDARELIQAIFKSARILGVSISSYYRLKLRGYNEERKFFRQLHNILYGINPRDYPKINPEESDDDGFADNLSTALVEAEDFFRKKMKQAAISDK